MDKAGIIKLIAMIGGAAVLLLYISRFLNTCSEEGECGPVYYAKNRITSILVSKYNMSADRAFKLADDLLSGDRSRAMKAAEEINRVGAIMDVMKVFAG